MAGQIAKLGSQDGTMKTFLVCHTANGNISVIYNNGADTKVSTPCSVKLHPDVENSSKYHDTVVQLQERKNHNHTISANSPSTDATSGHYKHTNKEYICDMGGCRRSFSSLAYLRVHQTVHYSKELKCSYPECGRKFTWAHHLQYHLKAHKGEKPYKCGDATCNKSFCTRQQMNVHMRTHTGAKPFTCEVCNKEFTTLQNRDNHARTHTGLKPYACDFVGCAKKFAESSSLKKHVVVHTGEKPYKCVHCQKCFTQSSSLRVHVSRYHTENAKPSKSIANIHLQIQQQKLEAQKEIPATTDNICQEPTPLTTNSTVGITLLSQPSNAFVENPQSNSQEEMICEKTENEEIINICESDANQINESVSTGICFVEPIVYLNPENKNCETDT